MKSMFAVAAIVALSSFAFAKPMTPISPAEMQSRMNELVQAPWDGKSTSQGTVEDDGCLKANYMIQVTDPNSQETKSYQLNVESPRSKQLVPVVIIVPTIEGTRALLEPVAAHKLCKSGIATVIADVNDVSAPKSYPAWGAEDINTRWAMLALRTTVDFARSIVRFDKDKIGALGFSLGGITTATFAGIEPRLKASVIIVGGGNLPYTLSYSDHGIVADLRENRMKAAGFTTVDQYEDKLRQTILFDPFYFASNVRRENVMMVMAETDVKVPYVVQKEQWQAFGQPASLTFTGGHVATIVQMVYLYMDDVSTFFNKHFNTSPSILATLPIEHKTVDLDQLGL